MKKSIFAVISVLCLTLSLCCGCFQEPVPWTSLYETTQVKSVALALITEISYDPDAEKYDISYETLAFVDVDDVEWFFSELNKIKSDNYYMRGNSFYKEDRVFVIEYLSGDYEILSEYTQFQAFDNGCQQIFSQLFRTEENPDAFNVFFVRCLAKYA